MIGRGEGQRAADLAEPDRERRLEAAELERADLGRERAELKTKQAQLALAPRAADAARAAAPQEAAGLKRIVGVENVLRSLAARHPWLACQVLRSLRVLWWTVNGQLPARLRARRTARPASRFPSHLLKATPSPALLPVMPHPPQQVGCRGPLLNKALALIPEEDADAPLVSVVVTSFNYGRYLEAAVDSVLQQTLRNIEVIVVEGGSTDPVSRAVAAGLKRPRTLVLMQPTPEKAGANRNFGIAHARGRYICCLDADDELAPTYLEKAVFLLERHGYDVVSSALMLIGEQSGVVDILERPDLAAILQGNHVLTCAVFRRSFWVAAGGFRDLTEPSIGHVHEDWAFWIRLAALGARFRNLARDPLLRYRVHAMSLSQGSNVLPLAHQRLRVRAANEDLLEDGQALARSRALAATDYGTPVAPPARIILDREPSADPDRPALLLAVPYLVLGGAERLLSAIVGNLVAHGWRITIVTTILPRPEQGDTTAWFEQHTDEIFHLPRGLPPDLWEDFLRHLIASRNIRLLWLAGSAVVYDCLRDLKAEQPALRVVDLLFNTVGHTTNNRRRRDLIDLTLVENREVLDWLTARSVPGERFRLIPSGVDLRALAPASRNADFLEQIGATQRHLLVGFVGRWSDEKNPVGFVEIARRVDRTCPIRFVMTGRGPLQPEVEAAIAEAGLPEGRFHLLHDVPELTPILASLDLLVLPSILDGRPVAVMEALALGVPVLASRVGGLPELIIPGRTGWLQEAGDLDAFARSIEIAESDRPALAAMRREARAFAEAHLDSGAMLEAYRAALTQLFAEARSAA